jgi:hypothetical protein
MKKIIIFLSLVSVCFGDSWYTVYLNEDGTVKGKGYNENTKPAHALIENEYPANYSFPTNDFKYWKKVGNDWVSMTTNEQAVVDDTEKTIKADFELPKDVSREQLKALVLVLIDEINILRAKLALADRTPAQVKTAIKNKL